MAIQFLRGTKSTLSSSSQIFLAGQPVFETDSGQLKIGDGVNSFSNLPYVGEGLFSDGGSNYPSVGSNYVDLSSNLRFHWGQDSGPSDLEDMSPITASGGWKTNNAMYQLDIPNALSKLVYVNAVTTGNYEIAGVSILSGINTFVFVQFVWNTSFTHGYSSAPFDWFAISSN